MTCIVGVVDDNDLVWMGADSAGVDDQWVSQPQAAKKIFYLWNMVVGFSTSFRFGQIVRYRLNFSSEEMRSSQQDTTRWMCTTFVDKLRACLLDNGFARKEPEGEDAGGLLLVGVNGNLYEIATDFSVLSPIAPYAAIGCGAQVALGALHATGHLSSEERIRAALAAAADHSAGVSEPFHVLGVKP